MGDDGAITWRKVSGKTRKLFSECTTDMYLNASSRIYKEKIIPSYKKANIKPPAKLFEEYTEHERMIIRYWGQIKSSVKSLAFDMYVREKAAYEYQSFAWQADYGRACDAPFISAANQNQIPSIIWLAIYLLLLYWL